MPSNEANLKMNEVLDLLSNFKMGHFGKNATNQDPKLKPIVDKLCEIERAFDLMLNNKKKEMEEKIAITFETMADGLVVQDSKGAITQFNTAALSILGLSEDQLLGRTSMDPNWRSIRIDGSVFPGNEHPAMLALDTGKKIVGQLMGLHLPSGKERWIRINATPFVPKDSLARNDKELRQARQVVCTFSDVTDLILSQRENRFLLDSLQIGVWKFNPIDQTLNWDNSMYGVFDIDKNDFSGHYQAWESALTADSKAKAIEDLTLALKGEKEFDTLFEINTKSKGKRIISGLAKVVRDTNGSPIMMYGINMDVTEKYKQIEYTKSLLDQNIAILKSAKFSVITGDVNGLITGFNKEAENILGYTADEVIGRCTPALFHDPEEVIKTAKLLSEEFKTNVPVGFETFVFKAKLGTFDERQWTYIRKDKTRVQVRLNVTSLYDKSGKLYGYMGIARDLTEELKLQMDLELERAKSIHNAKLASLGEMSAGIAHEINNPLGIIVGNIPLLHKFKDDESKFLTKTDAILKAASKIEKIVKGLKKFSRSTATTEFKLVSLDEVIREAIVITDSKSNRHNIQVTIDTPGSLKVLCDEVEIEQVLVNLINNAIDAVKNNEDKWVKIKAFEDSGKAFIQIIDSGSGISPEVENKLFQPFFTTKPVGEGTGLGLSISKGILDQHDATLTLNRTFQNTCFEICFPRTEDSKNGG